MFLIKETRKEQQQPKLGKKQKDWNSTQHALVSRYSLVRNAVPRALWVFPQNFSFSVSLPLNSHFSVRIRVPFGVGDVISLPASIFRQNLGTTRYVFESHSLWAQEKKNLKSTRVFGKVSRFYSVGNSIVLFLRSWNFFLCSILSTELVS